MATDVVTLPLHVKWSGPRTYDLSNPQELRRLYQLVLREGNAEDVRRFIDPAVLEEVLVDLVLPRHVALLWRETLDSMRR